MAAGHILKKRIYNGEEIEVMYRDTIPLKPEDFFGGWGYYGPLNPRTYMADDDIICEQDVALKLRDGTMIYTDIYRPDTQKKVPVIIAWSFYGKRPHDYKCFMVPGVPDGAISDMTKVEAPDPSYWCRNGYAVANPDPRGIGNSEGIANLFGRQDGVDCYDFIEWISAQDWCNGRVGMSGNSALAIAQWFAAAEQPPHLAAIAPWEGYTDLFREANFEDGIPCTGFVNFACRHLGGKGLVEDDAAMSAKYPLINGYWKEKIVNLEKINVPAYICAGWSHVHLRGTVNAYEKISSKSKWIRFHRDFEWPDYYSSKNLEDLRRFFDRYLKNIHNGWELTPRVRLDVMDSYDCDYQVERPEIDFPLHRTMYTKLYLDASNHTMANSLPADVASVSYHAEDGQTQFTIQFNEDVEITGHSKLKLWVEAQGNDDMDLFITMLKLSKNDDFMATWVLGQRHPGASGKLRVSHRALDEKCSTEVIPIHSHLKEEKLKPGEIVPVEIEIVATSRIWHKGEKLQIRVAGHYIRDPWFEPHSWELNNKGNHIIHTGGEYDSYLLIPVIPAKLQTDDYIYR